MKLNLRSKIIFAIILIICLNKVEGLLELKIGVRELIKVDKREILLIKKDDIMNLKYLSIDLSFTNFK
jgi:hypothetical protein